MTLGYWHAHPKVPMADEKSNEVMELCRKAQSGDIVARNKLIVDHMRVIHYTLKKFFHNSTGDYDDMVNEAVFGLIRAIMGFNPEKSDSLVAYAIYWIRAVVGRRRGKENKAGTSPGGRGRMVRLHEPITADDGEGGRCVEDLVADDGIEMPDETAERSSNKEMLERVLSSFWNDYKRQHVTVGLRDAELVKAIIIHRLLAEEPISLKEVGLMVGHSRESVRLYEERIMDSLKKRLMLLASD